MNESDQLRIFDDWMDQNQSFLLKVARSYTTDQHDRDDLFQEIAIEIWKSIPSFRGDSAVRTWLYRIALRTAFSWSGRQRRHSRNRTPIEGVIDGLSDRKNSPSPGAVWLQEQIATFNEIDRSVALMLLDGQSYAEIAQVLGLTESNVGVRIHRVKKELVRRSKGMVSEGEDSHVHARM